MDAAVRADASLLSCDDANRGDDPQDRGEEAEFSLAEPVCFAHMGNDTSETQSFTWLGTVQPDAEMRVDTVGLMYDVQSSATVSLLEAA